MEERRGEKTDEEEGRARSHEASVLLPVPSEELTEVRGFKWEKWQKGCVFQRHGPLQAHLRRKE